MLLRGVDGMELTIGHQGYKSTHADGLKQDSDSFTTRIGLPSDFHHPEVALRVVFGTVEPIHNSTCTEDW